MKNPTIQDILFYVNRHPDRDKVFRGWTDVDVVSAVNSAIDNNALVYLQDHEGRILAFAFGIPRAGAKTFYVSAMMSSVPGTLPAFLGFFKQLYPDWKLEGHRRGKLKEYMDGNRLIRLSNILSKEPKV